MTTTAALSTCHTCRFWRRKQLPSVRADDSDIGIGLCHALPPGKDWGWPKTKGDDGCGCWTSSQLQSPPDTNLPPTAPARARRRTSAPE